MAPDYTAPARSGRFGFYADQRREEPMAKRLVMLVAVFTFVAATVHAQDARAVLQASLKAMGGENLKTIEYSGAGWSSQIGQTYGAVDGDWPHFEVAGYTRIIDYDARWSREDYTRRQGNYPTFGRAPMPETHVTAILNGNYAWDMNGNTPVPLTRMYLEIGRASCRERGSVAVGASS